jgi:uncharacterized membrane protein YhaH (DUF805 family)
MNWYFTALRKYAIFSGRASRSEYWYFALFNLIIVYALTFISTRVNMPYLALIYQLGVLIPNLAVSVRRMHDVGKPGWYCLIPFYNLYLACTASERGENEYGPNPFEEQVYGADDYEKPYDINA